MPIFFRHFNQDFGVWKITEDLPTLFLWIKNRDFYLPQLEKLHSESRRKEWLACRVLLQTMLDRPVEVDYLPNGTPFLRDSSLSVSFSHTKGFAAAQISSTCRTGIDIEYRSDRVKKIRSRFMHPDEMAAIDTDNESDHLLIHWCAKETLFKLLGEQKIDFANDFRVQPFHFSNQGIIFVDCLRHSIKQTFRLAYMVCINFVMVRVD